MNIETCTLGDLRNMISDTLAAVAERMERLECIEKAAGVQREIISFVNAGEIINAVLFGLDDSEYGGFPVIHVHEETVNQFFVGVSVQLDKMRADTFQSTGNIRNLEWEIRAAAKNHHYKTDGEYAKLIALYVLNRLMMPEDDTHTMFRKIFHDNNPVFMTALNQFISWQRTYGKGPWANEVTGHPWRMDSVTAGVEKLPEAKKHGLGRYYAEDIDDKNPSMNISFSMPVPAVPTEPGSTITDDAVKATMSSEVSAEITAMRSVCDEAMGRFGVDRIDPIRLVPLSGNSGRIKTGMESLNAPDPSADGVGGYMSLTDALTKLDAAVSVEAAVRFGDMDPEVLTILHDELKAGFRIPTTDNASKYMAEISKLDTVIFKDCNLGLKIIASNIYKELLTPDEACEVVESLNDLFECVDHLRSIVSQANAPTVIVPSPINVVKP